MGCDRDVPAPKLDPGSGVVVGSQQARLSRFLPALGRPPVHCRAQLAGRNAASSLWSFRCRRCASARMCNPPRRHHHHCRPRRFHTSSSTPWQGKATGPAVALKKPSRQRLEHDVVGTGMLTSGMISGVRRRRVHPTTRPCRQCRPACARRRMWLGAHHGRLHRHERSLSRAGLRFATSRLRSPNRSR